MIAPHNAVAIFERSDCGDLRAINIRPRIFDWFQKQAAIFNIDDAMFWLNSKTG